ncbi:MAG TPA: ATP synthase F1 subunit gamma [Saprospiraceae bacterium]|nr:ATP synthase F1 subunit gamma [Saprospiraceae bacterium]
MGANLKEVRDRIKSVKSTQQITKAMKMVSASKLRRAQDAITKMRPYSNKLNEMLTNILSNLEGDVSTSFGQERPIKKVAMVIVTSNRGLCGGFNSNIIKSAVATINEKYSTQAAQGNIDIYCIGKKGNDYFKRRYDEAVMKSDHVALFSDLSFDNVAKVSKKLMTAFEDEEYDAIEVSYGRFKNAAMQFAETEQFLPVEKLEKEEGSKKHRADYIFEPSKEELLKHLVPSILQTQFQKFVLDTHASEHGARMTAMDKASENADEMLKDLKIHYNKARQEVITRELSEIVGGAAALEGS